MTQSFSSSETESEGSGGSTFVAQRKRKREAYKKKEESISGSRKRKRLSEDDTSFFDKSLQILSKYREMGLPVPTYWGALDLIKQKTTHEAYWFSRANDEDRLYWLMRLTPKGATHAFHHWRRTEAKLVIQQSFKNSTEQNLKKETDDDDDVILAVDSPSHINLTVKTLDGSEVYFKVEPHSKLEKLMQAYREHVNIHSLMFLFDGSRLRGEQTPYELEMKDGDVIRVMHSLGGQCHVTS